MNLLALILAASMMATPHPKAMMTHGHAMHSSAMHSNAMHSSAMHSNAMHSQKSKMMHAHMMASPSPKP